ncbi:hypothetical protein TSUD_224320 [Trifolium subterraneum]|uniref:Uncharacterized protein n=1 Tax=Trifolium subterraneum TaxID=3900 RepID=A0A2Z6M293_TRISU|nr:hypothetical protein TSUD_224320 [Trifolium subterraneum]
MDLGSKGSKKTTTEEVGIARTMLVISCKQKRGGGNSKNNVGLVLLKEGLSYFRFFKLQWILKSTKTFSIEVF